MTIIQRIVSFKDKEGRGHKYLATIQFVGDGWRIIDSDIAEIERIKQCK